MLQFVGWQTFFLTPVNRSLDASFERHTVFFQAKKNK